ncbi:hypothetical protein Q8A67_024023 [Cirrhinus molitorella]|uniref:Uncharacterized protein n=1 Tax=Cirrhinus molitorella TaxID=172907 RepID=A0AA88P125_9TELE|nr:hypothetical protein Q8A67_024023 [Cirrhinus molitorella]
MEWSPAAIPAAESELQLASVGYCENLEEHTSRNLPSLLILPNSKSLVFSVIPPSLPFPPPLLKTASLSGLAPLAPGRSRASKSGVERSLPQSVFPLILPAKSQPRLIPPLTPPWAFVLALLLVSTFFFLAPPTAITTLVSPPSSARLLTFTSTLSSSPCALI